MIGRQGSEGGGLEGGRHESGFGSGRRARGAG